MRVLHISKKLPDVRVEKCIIGDRKDGHDVAFAGYSNDTPIFDEIRDIKQYTYRFGHAHTFGPKRHESIEDLQMAIEDFDPDFLHVHDIYFAILAMHLDRPWLYNDHEAWSNQISTLVSGRPKWSLKYWRRTLGIRARKRMIDSWEPRVLKDRVTITISERLADMYHRMYTRKTFVIPNFPMLSEVPKKIVTDKQDCMAYVGSDLLAAAPYHRDTRGFLDVVRRHQLNLLVVGDRKLKSEGTITSLGYRDHTEIMDLIGRCRFGVVAFRNYPNKPIHLGDHNKISLYAHSGQIVIAPRTLTANPHVKYIEFFDRMSDIPQILKEAEHVDPEVIANHAKEHMIWDRYFPVQTEANTLLIESM